MLIFYSLGYPLMELSCSSSSLLLVVGGSILFHLRLLVESCQQLFQCLSGLIFFHYFLRSSTLFTIQLRSSISIEWVNCPYIKQILYNNLCISRICYLYQFFQIRLKILINLSTPNSFYIMV